jgi:tetratricopeptide (TPR) repeat protein
MFAGQYHVALDAVARLELSLTPELVAKLADFLEMFAGIRVEVLVRFGRWDDLIALGLPREEDQALYAVTTATIHYGKGVAYAAKGDVEKASEERELLYAAVDRIPSSRISVTPVNKSHTVMQVAKAMLDGELEYRKGNYDVAFKHLETAVEREDALNYAEPWPWMMPSRHAYAALLLEQGRVEEAAKTYAADLGLDEGIIRARQHPNNVWALQGYFECLGKLGRTEEAKMVGQQLKVAKAVADVDVQSSCYCRSSCCTV